MFKCEETLDLAFDPTKVEASTFGGRLYVHNAVETEWRWLTPTEESEYRTWEKDHARASDDGMPEVNDNDLGVDWGKIADAPNGTLTIAIGKDAATDKVLDNLYGAAATLLSESRQDPTNKRFALLVFDMKDVDPETTEGSIDAVRLAGSAGDEMIENYIRGRRLEAILQQMTLETAANELEI